MRSFSVRQLLILLCCLSFTSCRSIIGLKGQCIDPTHHERQLHVFDQGAKPIEKIPNGLKNHEVDYLQLHFIKNGDVVLDVGAHKGMWSEKLIARYPFVNLSLFEPALSIYQPFLMKLEGRQVDIYKTALSEKEEQRTFWIHSAANTKSKIYSKLKNLTQKCSVKNGMQKIEAQCDTLDNFCRRNGMKHIDYLKLTTVGSEFDVLKGAEEMLGAHQIKTIQFQYGKRYLSGKDSLRDIFDYLTGKDYLLFSVAPNGLIHLSRWDDTLEKGSGCFYLALVKDRFPTYRKMQF